MMPTAPPRPQFRNINALTDLPTYRLPAAGWVSILHRVSGVLMFLLLPFVLWLFDQSLTSELSFGVFAAVFTAGIAWVPGWVVNLLVLALIWAFAHHSISGLRHLFMDATHRVGKSFARGSAVFTLAASLSLTALLGAKLFGLY